MSKTINILLAEDERTLAMIIQDTLDGQGFHVPWHATARKR